MEEQCPVCKSDRYLNTKLRLLVSSICYHKMYVSTLSNSVGSYVYFRLSPKGVNRALIDCSPSDRPLAQSVPKFFASWRSYLKHSRISQLKRRLPLEDGSPKSECTSCGVVPISQYLYYSTDSINAGKTFPIHALTMIIWRWRRISHSISSTR